MDMDVLQPGYVDMIETHTYSRLSLEVTLRNPSFTAFEHADD